MTSIISLDTSKDSPTSTEDMMINKDLEIEAPSMTSTASLTEQVSDSGIESSNPCMKAATCKKATDEEKSPLTETDLSEPKTGTTAGSYETGVSSPMFLSQSLGTFHLQQKATFDDEEKIASITHLLPVQGTLSLNLASLIKEVNKVDELGSLDAQDSGKDHTNRGRKYESTSMWANRVADSYLSKRLHDGHDPTDSVIAASAPELHPQFQTDMETGGEVEEIPQRMLLEKAGSASAYNPHAVEWCPSSQQQNSSQILSTFSQPATKPSVEAGQSHPDRPHLTVTVGNAQSLNTLRERNYVPTSIVDHDVHHLNLFTSGIDEKIAVYGKRPIPRTVTTSGMVSNNSNNSIEEPSLDGKHTMQPGISSPKEIYLPARPTLAQRRAEKQFAHARTGPFQDTLGTVKSPPASLLIAPDPGRTKVNLVRSASATSFPPCQPHVVSHSQSLTWKSQSESDLDHTNVHPELTKWAKVEQDLLRMGLIKRFPGKQDGGSFVVPTNLEQWLEFRTGRTEDLLLQDAARILTRNLEFETAMRARRTMLMDNARQIDSPRPRTNVKVGPIMGGKDYHDGRGVVLAQPTTWSPWYKATEQRPQAPWPCAEEMQEEGDERHTSAFGRFLGLPRVPGNPTVVWKVKPVIPTLHFDEVWKVPNKDTWADLYAQKPDDLHDEYLKSMVGRELLDAIDC